MKSIPKTAGSWGGRGIWEYAGRFRQRILMAMLL